MALRTFALVRIGLVAGIVDGFVWTLFAASPMTLQTSARYAHAGYVSWIIVGTMAIYGLKTAFKGRPVLNRQLSAIDHGGKVWPREGDGANQHDRRKHVAVPDGSRRPQ